MEQQLFYRLTPLPLFTLVAVVLFLAALAGFCIGQRRRRQVGDGSLIGTVQASMLGMLALLLGFTFAVASSRYDARWGLVVDEANAVGTTFMRAQTLPEPYRTNISDMLRDYIDLRLEIVSYAGDIDKVMAIRRETEELQQRMWGQAVAMARDDPRSVVTGLLITSLNQSIDLYSTRTTWFLARVPVTILWILSFIAIAAFVITGYSFGLAGQRSAVVVALMSLMVAAVIVMIVDLDRPAVGPTTISQRSLMDLRNSLSGFEHRSSR